MLFKTMRGCESYQFGEFLLEVAERRLFRAGQPIQLAPKTHDVLVALLRRAGGLVRKQELLTQVWPEACVEEGILAVHISALRRAFNGNGGTRYIETVSRSGYRFTAPVVEQHRKQEPTADVVELCNRGRAHLRAASMNEVPNAFTAFRAAASLDPACAAAHAGVALTCCAQAQFRMAPFPDAYAEAKTAALRALATDPLCAAAQTALGAVLFFSEWDWLAAERSLRRALELDPEQTEAYLMYGQLLEALGRSEAGLAEKRKALELEPRSPAVHFSISFSYWNQRRYDETIEWANKTLALDPAHPHAREFLAGAYLKKGDFDQWLEENVAHAQAHGIPASVLEPVREAYARGGRAGLARLSIERASRQPQVFPPMQLAIRYAEIGDMDSAFEQLERAIDSRDPGLVHLAVGPQWDSLRHDPRFLQCLRSMGLKPVRQN
jgi:DNA-binding winged helix-turn-helix (wHTH) protein